MSESRGHGGPRENSGGARPGAGRPPKPPSLLDMIGSYDDPEKFLRAVMNASEVEAKIRVDAAKALMPYVHAKKADPTKKGDKEEAAKKAATGRFAPKSGPRLVANSGRPIAGDAAEPAAE